MQDIWLKDLDELELAPDEFDTNGAEQQTSQKGRNRHEIAHPVTLKAFTLLKDLQKSSAKEIAIPNHQPAPSVSVRGYARTVTILRLRHRKKFVTNASLLRRRLPRRKATKKRRKSW